MAEQYLVWVLLVGIGIGAAATWFALGRLARRTDDISPPELAAEAEWISRTIEQRGGVAPAPLVEEVLELHVEYISGEPLEIDPAMEPYYATPATSEIDELPGAPASRPEGEPQGR